VTSIAELLPARRERSGEATRRRILDAAEVEFASKGFDGARLAAIARSAEVPQALIHHHFGDKQGLYREVLERALAAMAAVGWHIVDTLGQPRKRGRAKRLGRAELESLVEALVGMLVDFYATHARVLRILRLEAMRGGPLAGQLVRAHVKPQLDDVVARFEEMRASGEIRADVDPRHLCISTVAMACFPTTEEAFIEAVWSMDPQSPVFLEERRREIVRTVMARITP
jgi:TetR/AcrR family transcriptional regulator